MRHLLAALLALAPALVQAADQPTSHFKALTVEDAVACVSGKACDVSGLKVTPNPNATVGSLARSLAPHVASNAELATLFAGTAPVIRQGYAAAGDGGRGVYTYSSSPCSISGGDGGSQVQSAVLPGCWTLDKGQPLTFSLFGADCTNAADSTGAVQRAITAAIALRRTLTQPGDCVLRLTSTITGSGVLNLRGPGVEMTDGANTGAADPQAPGKGLWFHLAHAGKGFILQPAGGISPQHFSNGNHIEGVGTFRDQPRPGAGAYAPCACDYDFAIYNAEVEFDVAILNSTRGIYFSKGDRSRIKSLKGQPLQIGVNIESAYDTPVIDDMHLWPYWSNNTNVLLYTNNNMVALQVGRADNLVIKKVFVYGGAKCLDVQHFSGGPDGSYPPGTLYNAQISALDCDNSFASIVVEPAATGANLSVASLVGFSSGLNYAGSKSNTISVLSNNAVVSIGDASLSYSGQSHVYVGGQNARVQIGTLLAGQWNTGTTIAAPTHFEGLRAPGTGSQILVGAWNYDAKQAATTLPLFGTNAFLNTISLRPISAAPNIDTSASAQTVANGGTLALPTGSGELVVRDSAYGNVCKWLYSTTRTFLIGGSANCAASVAAGKLSLTWSGSAYVLTNNLGGSTAIYANNSRVAPFN
ncbi:hypothetical protein M446_6440 [Methylobacterium sp. 4-46]|uniref:hypothetical protein n=1 Tax=unclassified Methylobacterium TaxID=2615210 RepID=UPI000152C40C|nr:MULTISPECIES: hypothetical protein [Methylobacterium]ACA20699.1 hypothetical protein M446_6440 [Methylobacterium sp. 4-46]WFT79857.1 hypothetical protein QA634_32515 [Methylobacterium nodulans]